MYNDDLKNWDIKRIRQSEKVYVKLSKGIQYQKQELLDNIIDES